MERITPKNFEARTDFTGCTYYLWARAGYNPSTQVVYQIQNTVSCKDHLVDTFLKPALSYGYDPNTFSTEIKESTWIIVNLPQTKANAEKHIRAFQDWELKQKASVSQFYHDISLSARNGKGQVYWVNYDPQWATNCAVISAYLSIMRIFLTGLDLKLVFDYNSPYVCNEVSYIKSHYTRQIYIDFIKYSFKNLYRLSKKVVPHTKEATRWISHGGSGIFYYINNLHTYLFNKTLTLEAVKGYYKSLTGNYWTLIWDEYFMYLKRKEQRRVKMQGLQQTPKRPRTTKKTTL